MATDKGIKFDSEKLQWDLLPFEAVEKVVDVLMVGAKKYTPDGWKTVPDREKRYFNALVRHISATRRGEKNDPDDGLSHLAHIACNALFLVWYEIDNARQMEDKGIIKNTRASQTGEVTLT